MENNLENLTIGVFARTAGVNVETIRFYQRKGLLPEPDKPYGSIRRYGETDVTRVRFVKSAQRLGFSLDEIAELLRLEDGTHCDEASRLAEHKLQDVRAKLAQLRAAQLCTGLTARVLYHYQGQTLWLLSFTGVSDDDSARAVLVAALQDWLGFFATHAPWEELCERYRLIQMSRPPARTVS